MIEKYNILSIYCYILYYNIIQNLEFYQNELFAFFLLQIYDV